MLHLLHTILSTFSRFGISSLVDIVIVGLIFYGLLMLVRGTRADQILRGLIVVFIVLAVATSIFHLTMVDWLLRNSPLVLIIALPVIFAPELRRALEQVGRSSAIVNHPLAAFGPPAVRTTAVEEIVVAARRLSERRYGALMVIEGVTGLEEFVRSGRKMDADISADLLINIFFPNAPLHDGAVIIRGDRVLAAGCVLPLSDNLSKVHGTRHRAAVGITEMTDAACIVISEESGAISLARAGHLMHDVTPERLPRFLNAYYRRQIVEAPVSVAE
ncbi:MAG TPA: diadenylate cyclase CdaA, partial [Chloroflexota bacterium]|nr:diadenylate cyclase CdaA [Chloroflexota bacterium]